MQRTKNFALQNFDPIDEDNEDLSQDSDIKAKYLRSSGRIPLQDASANLNMKPQSKQELRKNYDRDLRSHNKENLNANKQPASKIGNGLKKKSFEDDYEEQISGLSGFSASDNEENGLFELAGKGLAKKYACTESEGSNSEHEEENESDNNEDSQLEDYEENLNSKQRVVKATSMQRPQTAVRSHIINDKESNADFHAIRARLPLERPQTAQALVRDARPGTADSTRSTVFRPVYTIGYQQSQIAKKIFNFKDKSFSTVPKKTDVVSRINAYRNTWNSTSFLKKNSLASKEGRKLNLAERNQSLREDVTPKRYTIRTAKFI